jgi:hypothetical protein
MVPYAIPLLYVQYHSLALCCGCRQQDARSAEEAVEQLRVCCPPPSLEAGQAGARRHPYQESYHTRASSTLCCKGYWYSREVCVISSVDIH